MTKTDSLALSSMICVVPGQWCDLISIMHHSQNALQLRSHFFVHWFQLFEQLSILVQSTNYWMWLDCHSFSLQKQIECNVDTVTGKYSGLWIHELISVQWKLYSLFLNGPQEESDSCGKALNKLRTKKIYVLCFFKLYAINLWKLCIFQLALQKQSTSKFKIWKAVHRSIIPLLIPTWYTILT